MKFFSFLISILFPGLLFAKNNVTYFIDKGTIQSKIIVSGQIYSPNTVTVTVEKYGNDWSQTIAWIAPEGSYIKKNDSVLKLSPQSVQQLVNQTNEQLLGAQLNLKVAEYKLKTDITKGNADLQSKKFALEKAKLDIHKADYVPLIEQQKQLITYNSAKADYEQAQKNLAQTKATNELQIKSLSIPVRQYQELLKQYKNDLQNMDIKAKNNGYLIYHSIQASNGWQKPAAGVTVWTMAGVADIADTSVLEVKLFIPEVDSSYVTVGAPVTLSLLSAPTNSFVGKVVSVSSIPSTPAARRGGEVGSPSDLLQQNEVVVSVKNLPKSALPGMTVKATIEPPAKNNVLRVPLFTLFSQPSLDESISKTDIVNIKEDAYVHVRKKGDKNWIWKQVKVISTSYAFAEISGDVAAGDEVKR
jgi:HlyD family secretion protein